MGRKSLSSAEKQRLVRRVLALAAGGTRRRLACKQVGISEATFYRYRSELKSKYPPIRRNWRVLAKTFRPELKSRVDPALWRLFLRRLPDDLRQIFQKPSRPRDTLARDELSELLKSLGMLANCYCNLDPTTRGYLEEARETGGHHAPFSAAFDRVLALIPSIEELRDGLTPTPHRDEHYSGPLPDDRAAKFVMLLAIAYCDMTGRNPTYTIPVNPDGQDASDEGEAAPTDRPAVPDSEFIRFVHQARDHFLAGTHIAKLTLHDQIRDCCARIDWS